jgi:6-phosphofructokinase 1
MNDAGDHVRVRLVDVTSSRYAIARRYMIRIRQADLVDNTVLRSFAACTNLTPEAFSARFSPLVECEPPPVRCVDGPH